MGDIGTIWFVARDEQTLALWSVVTAVGINPFTKQASEVTTLRLHAAALEAHQPSYARDGLMAEDVADLFDLDQSLIPLDINDDALYRFHDDAVRAFAKVPTTELPKRLAKWKAKMLRRGVPMANAELATVDEATKLHALAVHAAEKGGSLFQVGLATFTIRLAREPCTSINRSSARPALPRSARRSFASIRITPRCVSR